MWILPKQLRTSAFVADTKASDLDSEEFSQICEKSLTWRGKDSLARTWLQRWKRNAWMQHLCSRTLRPSLTQGFVTKWISSLGDSRASLSRLLENVKQQKTQDTSFLSSQTESETVNLELFSSKMLKESSPQKPQTENQFSSMSSDDWKNWVTGQRQEYSQRVKLAHLIRESGSLSWATPIVGDAHLASNPEVAQKRLAEGKATLSRQAESKNWPTARTSDAEGGRIETEMTEQGFKSKRHKSNQTFGAKLRDAVETYEENWPTPTTAEGAKIGSQPNYGQVGLSNHPSIVGQPNRAKLNKSGKNQESWPTPRANKVHPTITDENREQLANRKKANLEEDIAGHCGKATGKLNPNWVEQLMGLPVGWTDLGSWGMAASHKQSKKHS